MHSGLTVMGLAFSLLDTVNRHISRNPSLLFMLLLSLGEMKQ